MNALMLVTGRGVGLLGLVLCAIAVIGRLAGNHWIGGFQAVTLLFAGVAAMVAACFLLLWTMTASNNP